MNHTSTNRPPALEPIPGGAVSVGERFRYQANAVDPDGDTIVFDLPIRPDGMAIDGATGALAWLPASSQAGTHDVIVKEIKKRYCGVSDTVYTHHVPAIDPKIPPDLLQDIKRLPSAFTGFNTKHWVR